MFSWSSNPLVMRKILSDTRGIRKFKMAGAETGSTYNSASRLDSNAISKATPIFVRSPN
jgi:hypothetical protein